MTEAELNAMLLHLKKGMLDIML